MAEGGGWQVIGGGAASGGDWVREGRTGGR